MSSILTFIYFIRELNMIIENVQRIFLDNIN